MVVAQRKARERLERLKVKNDFIFQKIFGQNEPKEILISYLNAVRIHLRR
jgi:hypothetical protein